MNRDKVYRGGPCKEGHTLRYVANRHCVECQQERKRCLMFDEDRLEAWAARREPRSRARVYRDARGSKAEAIRAGARFYWGKRCARGHDTPRYASSGACIQCVRDRNAGPQDEYGLPI